MKFFTVFLLFCGFLVSCHAQNPLPLKPNKFSQNHILRRIYDFQDKRNTDSLLFYLTQPIHEYRLAAAVALGSVQDTLAIAELWRVSMQDTSVAVRSAAAFAIGQTGSSLAESRLIFALERERNALVAAAILEAIGKCATIAGIEFVAGLRYQSDTLRLGQAYCFYRAALKKAIIDGILQPLISLEGTFKVSELLLLSRNEVVRVIASAYFARNRKLIKEPDYKHQCRQLAQFDSDPVVRMHMTQALEFHQDDTSFAVLSNILKREKDYRVLVSAFRALKSYDLSPQERSERIAQEAERFFSDQNLNPNALIALAEMCQSKSLNASEENLLIWAQLTENYRARALLWGAAATKNINAKNRITDLISQTKKPYEKAALITALPLESVNANQYLELALNKNNPAVVRSSAIEALQNLHNETDFIQKLQKDKTFAEQILKLLILAVRSQDEAVSGLGAAILRGKDLPYKALLNGQYTFLEEAAQHFSKPQDVETYVEIAQTLAYLNDQAYVAAIAKVNQKALDWENISRIKQGQCVLMETSKGDIVVELLINETPLSVANFISLIRQGFYTNKSFHRVVQNFVAQGGCPRGDGWGSSPDLIRSEFTQRGYETGVLGLASAGKDTESCQWFFTHCPTPHLDGRYTIFGKIIIGQYVIDQLEIGDKIKKIEVLDN